MATGKVVLRAGRDSLLTEGSITYDQQHHILHAELPHRADTVRFLGAHYGQRISIELHNIDNDLKALK